MKIIALFAFLALISTASAYELGVSPPDIEFKGNIGEKICFNIAVFSKDYRGMIFIEDKWSLNKSRNSGDYAKTAEEIGLFFEYEKNFSLSERKDLRMCLSSYDKGKFFGLLLFKTKNREIEIGSWINAEINSKELSTARAILTGFSLKSIDKGEIILYGWILEIILCVVLLVIMILLARQKSAKNSFLLK